MFDSAAPREPHPEVRLRDAIPKSFPQELLLSLGIQLARLVLKEPSEEALSLRKRRRESVHSAVSRRCCIGSRSLTQPVTQEKLPAGPVGLVGDAHTLPARSALRDLSSAAGGTSVSYTRMSFTSALSGRFFPLAWRAFLYTSSWNLSTSVPRDANPAVEVISGGPQCHNAARVICGSGDGVPVLVHSLVFSKKFTCSSFAHAAFNRGFSFTTGTSCLISNGAFPFQLRLSGSRVCCVRVRANSISPLGKAPNMQRQARDECTPRADRCCPRSIGSLAATQQGIIFSTNNRVLLLRVHGLRDTGSAVAP